MTRRQADALKFIREYIARTGTSPSLREIATGLGLAGYSGAMRLVNALSRDGHLVVSPGRHRGIQIATSDIELPVGTEVTITIPGDPLEFGRIIRFILDGRRLEIGGRGWPVTICGSYAVNTLVLHKTAKTTADQEG
jgi:hypothetical protein